MASSGPVSVRAARQADLDRLADLETQCEGPDAWSRALIEEGVTGRLPTTTWWVAEPRPAEISGYAALSLAGDVAEMQRLGVDSAFRRARIATELVAEIVRQAGRAGAVRLLLEVREDNAPARGLYAATGFTEIGRRVRYYADGMTAIVMERTLSRPGRTAAQ